MLARPSETKEDGRHGDTTAAQRVDIFQRAQRHSRSVRVLKFILPVVGVLLAGLFAAQSYLAAPPAVAITAEGSAVSDGKLVMSSPKLEGFTSDDRPYSMSAVRAVQDVTNEAIVELEGIAAQLPIDEKTSAIIDAAGATLDRAKNTLDFKSRINIHTSDGATAKLQSAHIDIAAGKMSTDQPVDIRYKGASISSDTMSVSDNGKVVVFDKRVRVDIQPRTADTASQ